MLRKRIHNQRGKTANPEPVKGLSIIDPETGLYKEAYFRQRLREERRRSERSNSPLSLIVIDTNSSLSSPELSNVLAETVLSHTRETDIKAWYGDGKIAVLMPDTSNSGAEVLAKKLTSKADERLKGIWGGQHNWHPDGFITIATYPEKIQGEDIRLGAMGSTLEREKQAGVDCPESGQALPNCGGSGRSFGACPIYADLLDKSLRLQWPKAIKRSMDIIGSILGLILFSPALLGTALLIKISSHGPILFRQTRVGLCGKRFTLLKFRSMHHRSDDGMHQRYVEGLIDGRIRPGRSKADGRTRYKKQIEARITSVGRMLRKTAVDELPQLLNVLRGDMSLVGPRPHPVYEVNHYRLWHRHRLEMKPGVTGLSKLRISDSSENYNEATRLDLWYVKNWSPLLDLKIILKTIRHVILARGG